MAGTSPAMTVVAFQNFDAPPVDLLQDLRVQPVRGEPPEAARFQRALDKAEGSENKARQEVDGSACRGWPC